MTKEQVKNWLAVNGFKPMPEGDKLTRDGMVCYFEKLYFGLSTGTVMLQSPYEEIYKGKYGTREYEFIASCGKWAILGTTKKGDFENGNESKTT